MKIDRIYQSEEQQASANDATDLQRFINKNSCSIAVTRKGPTEGQSYAKPNNIDHFFRRWLFQHNFKKLFTTYK